MRGEQSVPQSRLAVMLRELNQITADPALPDDRRMIDEMLRRRTAIVTIEPQNDTDVLALLTMAGGATDALAFGDLVELQEGGIRRFGAELSVTIETMRKLFERRVGYTAEFLGLTGRSADN